MKQTTGRNQGTSGSNSVNKLTYAGKVKPKNVNKLTVGRPKRTVGKMNPPGKGRPGPGVVPYPSDWQLAQAKKKPAAKKTVAKKKTR